jgi:hypothetical protein
VWGKLELFKLPSETINKIESSSYLQWYTDTRPALDRLHIQLWRS